MVRLLPCVAQMRIGRGQGGAREERGSIRSVELITAPFSGWTGLVQWLSVRWWGVLAPPALLAALLLYWLPRAARAAGAPGRGRAFRQAGLLALGWAGVDLGLTVGLPLLQLSYAPVRSAFLYLFCGRTAIGHGDGAGAGECAPGSRTSPGEPPPSRSPAVGLACRDGHAGRLRNVYRWAAPGSNLRRTGFPLVARRERRLRACVSPT